MSWFKVERETWKSEVFKDEPFSEREAWFWLIGAACFKETTINILNNPVTLERGQLSFSLRFLAQKFKWSRGRVENYLKRLKNWDTIEVNSKTGQLIITICNYSLYQDGEDSSKTLQRHDKDTSKTKKKNDKEIKKDNNIYNAEFAEFWEAYVPYDMRKGSRKKSEEKYIKARKEKIEHETIIGKCREYIEHCHRTNCKTKYAESWLHNRGWEDEYQSSDKNIYHEQEAGFADKIKNAGTLAYEQVKKHSMDSENFELEFGRDY